MIYIDKIITFQGSREEPVKLAVVEETIKDLAQRFNVRKIRIESWQGISAVQNLQALGLPVALFTPTAKTNAEEWPVLAQRLSSGTLVLPPHARLREELLNLVYEVGPQGGKVIDRGRVHQDHAVAVRGVVASLAASRYTPIKMWGGSSDSVPDPRSVDEIQHEGERDQKVRAEASEQYVRDAITRHGVFFPGDTAVPLGSYRTPPPLPSRFGGDDE